LISKKSLFEETTVDRLQFFWALAGLILILNGAPVAKAQWISHGPEGGTIKALAIDPQTPSKLYAGTETTCDWA
jgi:hypothetical protein